MTRKAQTMSDGRRGSVKQSANGTWQFIVDLDSDELGPTGKPKRKQTRRRGFLTKKAAQAELTRTLTSIEHTEYVAPSRQTLKVFLQETWLPAIEHTVKPSTFDSYSRNVRLHVAGRFVGARQIQQVDAAQLNTLYGLLLAGDDEHRALSVKSVRYIHTILHRAFKDAVKFDAISHNPVEKSDPPKAVAAREMNVWTASQARTFLASTADDRLSSAYLLLLYTGMRRGEMLGLKWSDIDLEAKRLQIVRTYVVTGAQRKGELGAAFSSPKTAKGRRHLALDDPTLAALRAHKARQNQEKLLLGAGYDDRDMVFCTQDGTPIHPKVFSWYFVRDIAKADVPRIRLHDLRHTYATHALNAGVHPRIVQERLGHANVSITLDTYSHVDMDMQAAAAARVASLLLGDPS